MPSYDSTLILQTGSRIILVTDGLDGQAGGVQRVTRSVLDAVKNDGIRSLIWSSNDTGSEELFDKKDDVHIRCFRRRYFQMGLAALAAKLPASCQKVLCWHLRLSPIAALLAWRLDCPFEVFLHGVEAWGSFSPWVRKSLQRAQAFGVNSQYTLNRFREAHPELAHKPGQVIALGLNREFVSSAPSERNMEMDSTPFFLTVTRFAESYKGEEMLLQAFQIIRKIHPKLRLVCVGEGPRQNHWRGYADSLGLGEAVRFTGHIPDDELTTLYQRSRAFILLSEGEGFGIAFLEAMYYGKPCVATRVDASPEIVRDGVTGLLVTPRAPAAAAAAMQQLLENPDLHKRLGEEGRKTVLSNYMPEHFQQRLGDWMRIS